MSWAGAADFQKRFAITIDNVTGGGVGTVDIDFVISPSFDEFWDTVQSDGDDILVTEGDGITPIRFANGNCTGWDLGAAPFSGVTKTGSIRIDGWTSAGGSLFGPKLDAMNRIFVYYGDPTVAAPFTDGAVALGATRTTLFSEDHPKRSRPRVVTALERADAVKPRLRIAKPKDEIQHLHWDFDREMKRRFGQTNNRNRLEEVHAFELDARANGVVDNSVIDEVASLFLNGDVVRTEQTGGVDKQDYTLILKLHTTLGRVLDRRIVMAVRNPGD